jgi:hypothetical protein
MSVMPSCLRTTPERDSLERTILQSGAMKTPTGSSGSNSEPCRLPDTRLIAYGLAHVLGLIIAKAVHGQLAAGVPPPDVVRQVALFGIQNRDGWGVGLTILTALGNLLPVLPEEETYLALFHGARRVAADCDGQAPRRRRVALASRPDLATLKRWLRRERTLLTAVAAGASPAALAELLLAADTDRAFADGGHSPDFTNKAFECLDLMPTPSCPPSWARWWQLAVPRSRPHGASRST